VEGFIMGHFVASLQSFAVGVGYQLAFLGLAFLRLASEAFSCRGSSLVVRPLLVAYHLGSIE